MSELPPGLITEFGRNLTRLVAVAIDAYGENFPEAKNGLCLGLADGSVQLRVVVELTKPIGMSVIAVLPDDAVPLEIAHLVLPLSTTTRGES